MSSKAGNHAHNSADSVLCSQQALYQGHPENERRAKRVVALTFVFMLVEIIGGTVFNSMALLADGFHMATHVGALGISVFAYIYARRNADDPRYSFGTGKVNDLAGYTSALLLGVIALYVIYESVNRLLAPTTIVYNDAIAIACAGLCVNAVSAVLLHGGGGHSHAHEDHGHDYHHDHSHHHDQNFRSAYIHILADAVTSVLAIAALLCGKLFGWAFMDPVVGMVGAGVILAWTASLLRSTTDTLLDRAPVAETAQQIRRRLSEQDIEVTDLHLWRVAPGANAAVLSLTTKSDLSSQDVRALLHDLNLAHMTIEINQHFNL